MKRSVRRVERLIGFWIFLSLLGLTEPAGQVWADDPFVKLGRGLTNLITAPGELFIQPVNLSKNHDGFTALLGGIFKGITFMVLRQLSGVYETATFPIPLPPRYQPLWNPHLFPVTVPEAFQREFGKR